MKITLRMQHLPDLEGVGGNARHAHFMMRHRYVKQEEERWAWEARAALNQLRGRTPRFASAKAHVEVTFFTQRRRDEDNLTAACKPMWDALVRQGVLPDDNAQVLQATYEIKVDRKLGGFTIVTLEGPEA